MTGARTIHVLYKHFNWTKNLLSWSYFKANEEHVIKHHLKEVKRKHKRKAKKKYEKRESEP